MSKIFYDHLTVSTDIEKNIKRIAKTHEEKVELWHLVDEIIHHNVIGCILDNLPKSNHEEFLSRFHEHPHSDELWDYLKEKIGDDIEEKVKLTIENLKKDVVKILKDKSE